MHGFSLVFKLRAVLPSAARVIFPTILSETIDHAYDGSTSYVADVGVTEERMFTAASSSVCDNPNFLRYMLLVILVSLTIFFLSRSYETNVLDSLPKDKKES